jgi:DNA-binding response OmpR family regulator
VTEKKILVVEDDAATRDMIASYLGASGYGVETASDGLAMRQRLEAAPVDLLLLDLNLPDSDGLDLARQVRAASRMGIIIVTERDTPDERATGLEMGADDYITKPFFPRELLARVRNLLDRTTEDPHSGTSLGATSGTASIAGSIPGLGVRFGSWLLDCANRTLVPAPGEPGKPGSAPTLTPAEMDILIFLATHPRDLHSRELLGEQIGERRGDSQGGRGVDILISRLRRKLGCGDKGGPQFIETVRGHGYRFHPRG